MEENDTRN